MSIFSIKKRKKDWQSGGLLLFLNFLPPNNQVSLKLSTIMPWLGFSQVAQWWRTQLPMKKMQEMQFDPKRCRRCSLIPGSEWSPQVGNTSPLKHSCLENSIERGACGAAVHRAGHDWACTHTHLQGAEWRFDRCWIRQWNTAVYVLRPLDLCLYIFGPLFAFVRFNNNPKLMSPINSNDQGLLGGVYVIS